MHTTYTKDPEWLSELSAREPRATELLGKTAGQQQQLGYFHTLHEICRQPASWLRTSEQMIRSNEELRARIDGISSLVLTGSGSSEYAGDCVRPVLQNDLGVTTASIGSGAILMNGTAFLPVPRPCLVVSFARSGDSPESVGTLSLIKESEPAIRHLILTCNEKGSLATTYRNDPQVSVVILNEETNDRSLVMTNSFTNLVLAARSLGMLQSPDKYRSLCKNLSRISQELIQTYFGTFAKVARLPFQRAVFLGSGARFAAAREGALKMLEMTAGRVSTLCETFLGFRHGPMSYAHPDTLIVCFLSSTPVLRSYEMDLIEELNHKKLGLSKIIIGENIPARLAREQDVLVECPGLSEAGDDNAPVIHVVASQLLAFFRSLEEGLHPDSPSADGVINRVVQNFTLHRSPSP